MCEDTRARILHAAGPIFADKGFQRATVREICHAAGVNVASVNYHFGDKERLYIETIKRAKQVRNDQVPMPRVVPGASAEQRLELFVRTLLTRILGVEHATWQAKLMMREMLQPTRACDEVVEEYIRPEFNLLLEILADLLPPDAPAWTRQQVGFSVIGQCLFYRLGGHVVGRLIPADQRRARYSVEQLTQHICGLTLAALQTWERGMADCHQSEVQTVD